MHEVTSSWIHVHLVMGPFKTPFISAITERTMSGPFLEQILKLLGHLYTHTE